MLFALGIDPALVSLFVLYDPVQHVDLGIPEQIFRHAHDVHMVHVSICSTLDLKVRNADLSGSAFWCALPECFAEFYFFLPL